VVVDVIRATSTIAQALASGYERVYCAAEIHEVKELRDRLEGVTTGGEREGVRIDGFELGNSPLEYVEPHSPTLAISTTNGTRAVVAAAARCDHVLVASLLNLEAAVAAVSDRGADVAIICAGVEGAFALDDAYVAGRITELLDAERTDAAEAAVRLAASYSSPEEALRSSRSGRNLIDSSAELAADIPYCARESVLDVVPWFVRMRGAAAEITLSR
jgi:2-phosphosulfolactate phosphatase